MIGTAFAWLRLSAPKRKRRRKVLYAARVRSPVTAKYVYTSWLLQLHTSLSSALLRPGTVDRLLLTTQLTLPWSRLQWVPHYQKSKWTLYLMLVFLLPARTRSQGYGVYLLNIFRELSTIFLSSIQIMTDWTLAFSSRLVTLAVQNASLTIIMHYSRISTSPSQTYSAASAVLLNELLKGTISLIIAFSRIEDSTYNQIHTLSRRDQQVPSWIQPSVFLSRCKKLWGEILSPDCWKLSIPAILYGTYQNYS